MTPKLQATFQDQADRIVDDAKNASSVEDFLQCLASRAAWCIGCAIDEVKEQAKSDATPPRREWVGLTNEEESNLVNATWPIKGNLTDFLRAIEAKLKEKNT